jgi:hypothetical protein
MASSTQRVQGRNAEVAYLEERLVKEYKEAKDVKIEGLLTNRDGKDFRKYKWTMTTIFREYGLYDIVQRKLTREKLQTAEGLIAFDRKECTIMRLIGTTIPTEKLQQIDHLESGTEMWEALCEIYEKRADPTIRESVILKKSDELRALKCASERDVEVHLSSMFRLRTELASYGYEVNDINMKAMMLESLPDSYEFEQLRGGVKYGGNGGSLKPEGLRVLIEQAAERQSRRPKHNSGGSKTNRHGGGRGQQHGNGGSAQGQQQGTGQNQQNDGQGGAKRERRCFKCKQVGHLRANCPSSEGGNADGTQQRRVNFTNFTCNGGK